MRRENDGLREEVRQLEKEVERLRVDLNNNNKNNPNSNNPNNTIPPIIPPIQPSCPLCP